MLVYPPNPPPTRPSSPPAPTPPPPPTTLPEKVDEAWGALTASWVESDAGEAEGGAGPGQVPRRHVATLVAVAVAPEAGQRAAAVAVEAAVGSCHERNTAE